MNEGPLETTELGKFDPLEAPIVLDLMEENGIYAFSKAKLEDSEGQPYGNLFNDSGRGRLFVDASKLAEARRLIDEELPKILEEMQRGLAETDVGDVPEGEV